ncbi:VOC family protein [Paenibacillus wynnii]|uniref:VOC family protein n=1 Tax=Paenibacillus wynnii TaxID=268407 RepID=UPI002790EF27|nr:VOC family protein [Paenibacillus wynnii]MDQ0193223.1 catechol 2,3-dioxygenase-like lactoylglutathione lyase family enzyme [Paenibacillus wynnii]
MTEKHILRVATVEIPVTNLGESISWYSKNLGTSILTKTDHTAMLTYSATNSSGEPTLYLVETSDNERLTFKNSHTDITHSVIDFYVPDLIAFHAFLSENGVTVTPLHLFPDGKGLGGFGFRDPSGNSFGATNIVHS